jgi:hypothetical protein
MSDDEISPREADRIRRRNRDAEAQARAPMRTGLGKVFKQILDVQAKKAAEAGSPKEAAKPVPVSRRPSGP